MNDGPADPFGNTTKLASIAIQQHEMVETYIAAGFTRAEAIGIIMHMWSTFAMQQNQKREGE